MQTTRIMKTLSIATLILICLTSCKPNATFTSSNIGGLTIKLDNVSYTFAKQQEFSLTESKGTHLFTGDSLSFSVTNGTLTVNGKDIGTVKAGDTVSIDSAGALSINGQAPRTK